MCKGGRIESYYLDDLALSNALAILPEMALDLAKVEGPIQPNDFDQLIAHVLWLKLACLAGGSPQIGARVHAAAPRDVNICILTEGWAHSSPTQNNKYAHL